MATEITLKQIGELTGVSPATVSRVINNRSGVRPEVRELVLKVVAETGYQPNPVARRLAGQSARMLGLIIPKEAELLFNDSHFLRLLHGIAQSCQTHDYRWSLFFPATDEDAEPHAPFLEMPLFDGFLLIATQVNDPFVSRLVQQEIPFVLIGQQEDPHVSFVDVDHEGGAYTAVGHLIRLGHDRIATITGPTRNQAAVHRRQGYLRALEDRGRAIDESLIAAGDFSEVSGYESMQGLLTHQPDAVFAASDQMAFGALRALRQRKLTVPNDVAVIGFGDLSTSAVCEPPLTTVRQPIGRLGSHAVELLIDILTNGPIPPRHIVWDTQLVIRESCGANLIHGGLG